MIRYTLALALVCMTCMNLQAAIVLGVNFNNNDTAGAQNGTSTLGATWTDVNAIGGTPIAVNGSGGDVSITSLAASNFWQAGSWTGTGGSNNALSMMRVYLDDGGAGYSFTLSGLSNWLADENATAYRVTVYSSSDNGTAFHDVNINGSPFAVAVAGDGSWDGNSNDANGNITAGIRGSATSGLFSSDTLTLSSAARAGDTRGTIAGFTVTAVPEPSSAALLGIVGLAASFARRRRS